MYNNHSFKSIKEFKDKYKIEFLYIFDGIYNFN